MACGGPEEYEDEATYHLTGAAANSPSKKAAAGRCPPRRRLLRLVTMKLSASMVALYVARPTPELAGATDASVASARKVPLMCTRAGRFQLGDLEDQTIKHRTQAPKALSLASPTSSRRGKNTPRSRQLPKANSRGQLESTMRVRLVPHCCSRLSDAYGHNLHTLNSVGANMPTQSRRPPPEQIADELVVTAVRDFQDRSDRT